MLLVATSMWCMPPVLLLTTWRKCTPQQATTPMQPCQKPQRQLPCTWSCHLGRSIQMCVVQCVLNCTELATSALKQRREAQAGAQLLTLPDIVDIAPCTKPLTPLLLPCTQQSSHSYFSPHDSLLRTVADTGSTAARAWWLLCSRIDARVRYRICDRRVLGARLRTATVRKETQTHSQQLWLRVNK